jgi:dsDNA-binding SOS-regulon protein
VLKKLHERAIIEDTRDYNTNEVKIKALGDAYKRKTLANQHDWETRKDRVQLSADTNEILVLHYLNNKTKLEAMLKGARIESPADKLDETSIARGNLSRGEYRGMMLLSGCTVFSSGNCVG